MVNNIPVSGEIQSSVAETFTASPAAENAAQPPAASSAHPAPTAEQNRRRSTAGLRQVLNLSRRSSSNSLTSSAPSSPGLRSSFFSMFSSSHDSENWMARRAEVRQERADLAAKLATGGNPSPTAQSIQDSLKATAAKENGTILMVGYSPTGGGHTGRTLDIVELALNDNKLSAGDTVIWHVPQKWEGKGRPGQLTSLSNKLQANGINIILVEAEKSVQGYLNNDGSSDDPKILDRFAKMPWRIDAQLSTIADAKLFSGGQDEFAAIPSINANHMMDSVQEIIGDEHMDKVKVLTDMDPALQKAARMYGVPDNNRVDQQNHAILLNRKHTKPNLVPTNAVLAKVLSGYRNFVSHIGLGEKNTLGKLANTAKDLNLTAETTKEEARSIVAKRLLDNGRQPDLDAVLDIANRIDNGESVQGNPQYQGIMRHPNIGSEKDVKNIMYFYAHGNQNDIAQKIHAEIEKGDDAHQAYKDTLFVFCGADTMENGNAMHMAYLADGDGGTTAGAGIVGERIYLHKFGGSAANDLSLPIKGHNEQAVNADYQENHDSTEAYTTVRSDSEDLGLAVDTFVKDSFKKAPEKYKGDLGKLTGAVQNEETYVKQAKDILFDGNVPDEMTKIRQIEMAMLADPVLKANRHFVKLVFQSFAHVEKALDEGGTDGNGKFSIPVEVQFAKKSAKATYPDIGKFAAVLCNKSELSNLLGAKKDLKPSNLILLSEVRNFFSDLANIVGTGTMKLEQIESFKTRMADLKHKFGEEYVTGF